MAENQVFGVNELKAGEQRTFEFVGSPEKNRGVFLKTGGRTEKIIDLPIKGENEEGGALSSNTYHRVFGKKEPTKTYNIEGIETLTPAYNTARRATTITRIGSTKMKSALSGEGLTTRYGNYVGAEAGRFEKDTARSYRGYILQAQAYRQRGLPGDIKAATVLEQSANTIMRRWQHKINFAQALSEIHGEEPIPFIKSPEKTTPTYAGHSVIASGRQSTILLTEPSPNKSNEQSRSSRSSFEKESSINRYDTTISLSRLESIKQKESLSRSSFNELQTSKGKSVINKNPSRTHSITSRFNSRFSSSKSPSRPSSELSLPPSSSPKSPNSPSSPGSPSLLSPPSRPIITNTVTTRITTTRPVINQGINQKPQNIVFDLNIANKTTEGILSHGEDANFLGNTSESQISGIYNRKEITYGNKRISTLRSKDVKTIKKNRGKFETTTSSDIKLESIGFDRKQKVNKFENTKLNFKEKTKKIGNHTVKQRKGLGF